MNIYYIEIQIHSNLIEKEKKFVDYACHYLSFLLYLDCYLCFIYAFTVNLYNQKYKFITSKIIYFIS